ncbi:MAG: homocysteine S-methyltransferase family protein, partial [bacterium]
LINCVDRQTADRGLEILSRSTTLPIGVYAHGDGSPDDTDGWKFDRSVGPERYAQQCRKWVDQGANIIGGCCGTNPEYTKQYAD